MKSTEMMPELFSNRDQVITGRGGKIVAIDVPISPEGTYSGNGQFRHPGDMKFTIKGFDKTQGDEVIWYGQGFIAEQNNGESR